jgi:uncharacterized membrane protein YfcA
MHASPTAAFPLLVAGFVAGTVNSVAGGGSLVVFPALLAAGLSPLDANGTCSVSLMPGSLASLYGYRRDLAGTRDRVIAMAVPSVVGGVLGALFAMRLGDKRFAASVPWLILLATGLFAAQVPLAKWLARHGADAPMTRGRLLLVAGFQLLVALYGGFFGAGIGILMLAALGIAGERDIHRANALKSLAAGTINLCATGAFLRAGHVDATASVMTAAGAIAGGYLGAGVARRLGQQTVRAVVLGVGVALTGVMFARR